MTRGALLTLFLLLATSATAEPVRVSAGEHMRFTRLILDFGKMPQWQARRRGNAYRLKFSQVTPLSFDLSRVFRLIDRTRIADVRALGDNVLEIDLSCSCDVRVSSAGGDALVVDVHDLQTEDPNPQATIATLPEPADNEAAPELPGKEAAQLIREIPSTVSMPQLATLPDTPLSAPSALDLEAASQTGTLAVELVGRAFARAAAQGLISAEEEIPMRERQSTLAELRRLESRHNLSVTTSFDRSTRPDPDSLPPTDAGAQCLDDRRVDVAEWGDVSDNGALGRLRGRAIAENGSVDAKGATALARHYIHLGFGAEARIAAQYMSSSRDRDIILALADVMDDGRSDAPVLSGQAACQGIVALWAILAHPLDADAVPVTATPALAAFSALPSHLRTHLGPLLSERLHDIGLPEEARMAINAVTRGGTKTEESELASARLELAGTHADAARETLADLSKSTDLTAAAALLELLRDAEARGMAPNPAWVEDAPTLVGALEGTEIAERLNVAGLRGLIALGRFDEFRAALVEDAPGLTPDVRRTLAIAALQVATEVADDETFVTSELGLAKLVGPQQLTRASRLAMAERLHDIGLARRAVPYVEAEPGSIEELTIAVRVLLDLGRIEPALQLVSGSNLETVTPLRARTLVAAGDENSAIAAFVAAGDIDSAVAAALRSADWSWLAGNANDPVADAALALSAPLPEFDGDEDTPNGALIAASRDRRMQVRALLDATEPSSPAPAFTN